MIKQIQIREIAKMGITAAIYVALCLTLSFISYGDIQFRVSEMLLMLPFYNKKYCIPIILGTFIANMFSPMGVNDMIFGTAATVLVCVIIITLKSRELTALTAAVINGIIVGAELYFVLHLPFILSAVSVAIGEFVVVQIGVLIFSGLEKANPNFINLIRD